MHIIRPGQFTEAVAREVAPWIARAIPHGGGDESVYDILVRVYNGDFVMWHEPGKFCILIELQHHAQQKVGCVVCAAGSDLKTLKRKAEEQIIPWLREMGCRAFRTHGRPGWERVMGMRKIGVILQREI